MTYFEWFVIGSWVFVIGWYVGAVYMQNQSEKAQRPRALENVEARAVEKLEAPSGGISEPSMESEASPVVISASSAAD